VRGGQREIKTFPDRLLPREHKCIQIPQVLRYDVIECIRRNGEYHLHPRIRLDVLNNVQKSLAAD
jgi:hypothetical protein